MEEGGTVQPALSVGALLAELVTVSANWRTLGLKLGVEEWQLQIVERDNFTSQDKLVATLDQWSRKKADASWADVVRALGEMGESALAEKVKKKYLGCCSGGDKKNIVVDVAALATTRANVKILKANWADLSLTVCVKLTKEIKVNLEEFSFYVCTIISFQLPDTCTSVYEIIRTLQENKLLDFWNCNLLWNIVNKYLPHDEELSHQMMKYQLQLEHFKKNTKVINFIAIIESELSHDVSDFDVPRFEVEDHYQAYTFEMDADPCEATLMDVERSWHAQINQYSLPDLKKGLLHLIASSSILVSYLIPSKLVSEVVLKVRSGTTSFFQEQGILSITVGEERFYFETKKLEVQLQEAQTLRATTMDWKKPPNGAPRPYKIQRSKARYYEKPLKRENIAAIDFGTTSCSVAYYIDGKDKLYPVNLGSESVSRVSSNILISSSGTKVIKFGCDAFKTYMNSSLTDLYYFERVKMELQHDEDIHLGYTVKDFKGTKFYLVEVIAMILKYLKEQLLEQHSREHTIIRNVTDFDWVITVPATWRARRKQMMRLAAYKAGLTTGDSKDVIYKLSPVKRAQNRSEIESMQSIHLDPYHLSLAHEPEAAALYCKDEQKLDPSSIESKCYMVVDIGGGTTDITAHRIDEKGNVEVILPLCSIPCGGTEVNTTFKRFLGDLVGDPEFLDFLSCDDPKENTSELYDIINKLFEEEKQRFGNMMDCDDIIIRLPYAFKNTYKKILQNGNLQFSGGFVTIKGSKIIIPHDQIKALFKPTVDKIKECFLNCERKVHGQIKAVYLVGGFGGCKYIHQVLKNAVGNDIKVYRAQEHQLAVVYGAVLYGKNPTAVSTRIAASTYGTSCICKYDPLIHDEQYRFLENEKPMCRHLFSPFIYEGETLDASILLQQTFVPVFQDQKEMTFDIFSTHGQDYKKLFYTVSPNGEELLNGFEKLGILKIKLLGNDRNRSSEVVLTIDITQTEIQIQAYDKNSGNRVATVVDFLQSRS